MKNVNLFFFGLLFDSYSILEMMFSFFFSIVSKIIVWEEWIE